MERINCGLFSSPVFNGDASCNDISPYTFVQSRYLTVTNSSSHSISPLQICGVIDYENPKVSCTYKSGQNEAVRTGQKGNHKFVERKRREDMKTLYFVLRSLLPEEYIRGKRSTAEHLSQTTEYIKHLQHKVKELTQKREETRNGIIGGDLTFTEDLNFSVSSETFPTVKVITVGSGVLVSTNTVKSDMVLSDLLLTLENNGLDIVSASSSAMSDKIFHTIHAK
ncbi:hypothetical protein KI387_019427, partial [Taxus chinensis]